MFSSRKLRAVVRHEYLTIVKQPSFWISLISVPLIFAAIVVINVVSDSSKDVDLSKEKVAIAAVDESGLITADTASTYGVELKSSAERPALEQSVRHGDLDGLVVYPADLRTTGKYQLFADDTERNNGAVVTELGRVMLQQSLLAPLDDDVSALALTGGEASLQSYNEGQPAREITDYIVPGAFLLLFYVVLIFSVGYALTSVSEEKENRSIEMVLSYVKPQMLILGKLLGIILVTFTQIGIIGLIAATGYFIARAFGNELSLPFNVSDLSFVPSEILIGAGFLVFGFIFYVAMMAMIGAIFPSSKEANGFATVFYLLPAVPFWSLDIVVSSTPNTFAQALTYFPLTSPTTTLLRNAAGNLSVAEGVTALLILIVATAVTVVLAAKAFRLGTLEYSERIKFASLIKK